MVAVGCAARTPAAMAAQASAAVSEPFHLSEQMTTRIRVDILCQGRTLAGPTDATRC